MSQFTIATCSKIQDIGHRIVVGSDRNSLDGVNDASVATSGQSHQNRVWAVWDESDGGEARNTGVAALDPYVE